MIRLAWNAPAVVKKVAPYAVPATNTFPPLSSAIALPCPPGKQVEKANPLPSGFSFVMKPLNGSLPNASFHAFGVTGKVVELVTPVTYALPDVSTAMAVT